MHIKAEYRAERDGQGTSESVRCTKQLLCNAVHLKYRDIVCSMGRVSADTLLSQLSHVIWQHRAEGGRDPTRVAPSSAPAPS